MDSHPDHRRVGGSVCSLDFVQVRLRAYLWSSKQLTNDKLAGREISKYTAGVCWLFHFLPVVRCRAIADRDSLTAWTHRALQLNRPASLPNASATCGVYWPGLRREWSGCTSATMIRSMLTWWTRS